MTLKALLVCCSKVAAVTLWQICWRWWSGQIRSLLDSETPPLVDVVFCASAVERLYFSVTQWCDRDLKPDDKTWGRAQHVIHVTLWLEQFVNIWRHEIKIWSVTYFCHCVYNNSERWGHISSCMWVFCLFVFLNCEQKWLKWFPCADKYQHKKTFLSFIRMFRLTFFFCWDVN